MADDEATIAGGFFGSYDSHRGCQTLALDLRKSSPGEIEGLFGNFADLFFLTDNFSDVPAFGHPYTAGPGRLNKAYRDGAPVDVDGYSFELFFNEVPVARFGRGPRKVSLKLYN